MGLIVLNSKRGNCKPETGFRENHSLSFKYILLYVIEFICTNQLSVPYLQKTKRSFLWKWATGNWHGEFLWMFVVVAQSLPVFLTP